MIIAHLPAGYLLARAMQRSTHTPALLWAGMLGSIFPDIDLLYFYLVDQRQLNHHLYWTHLPVFWLIITGTLFPFLRWGGNRTLAKTYGFFLSGVWLHLCLDTLVSSVYWFLPFSSEGVRWLHFTVLGAYFTANPALNYIWNYMLHPIFALELVICLIANWLWLYSNLRPYLLNRPHIPV